MVSRLRLMFCLSFGVFAMFRCLLMFWMILVIYSVLGGFEDVLVVTR